VYWQILLGIPDENKRHDILQVVIPHRSLRNDVDLCYLAQATPGFTGADLSSLVRFAMTKALERWASSDNKVKACVTLPIVLVLVLFPSVHCAIL